MIKKSIALIAHDGKKIEILKWVKEHQISLNNFEIYATGTTGKLISQATGLSINLFESGPLGGDIQVGALMVENKLDILIFFWDPLEPQPHDPDVKALLRIAVLKNIPTACNSATADHLLISNSAITQDSDLGKLHNLTLL